jgi:hypothetical protein
VKLWLYLTALWIWIRNDFGQLNADPDPGGHTDRQKQKKIKKSIALKCWIFSFKGWRLLLQLKQGLHEGHPTVSFTIFSHQQPESICALT